MLRLKSNHVSERGHLSRCSLFNLSFCSDQLHYSVTLVPSTDLGLHFPKHGSTQWALRDGNVPLLIDGEVPPISKGNFSKCHYRNCCSCYPILCQRRKVKRYLNRDIIRCWSALQELMSWRFNSLRPSDVYMNIIGCDNGLSPAWCRAIIWTNAGILLIWP